MNQKPASAAATTTSWRRPSETRIVRADVEGAAAKLEDALQYLHGRTQALGARERAVKLDAAPPGCTSEFDARERFAHADLQIGERLIVLQIEIKARLNVLDQAGLQQERAESADFMEGVLAFMQKRPAQFTGG